MKRAGFQFGRRFSTQSVSLTLQNLGYREFMRKILVGKPILGWVSHSAGVSNREYGKILYGSNDPDKVLIQ